jgi:TolA-binding protein
MNVSTQAILNAKTCAQLSTMMEEVEAMQALIITQYEAIAMTEQQELNMLEEITLTEDQSATITDAREVYHRASIAHNDMIRMPAKCSVGGFEESECELTLIIDELKALGLTKEAEHCETLHSRMLTTYDAFLMNS